MNPAQQFVIDSRMLESGFSCILQLPTGAGKTWLARRAIHHVLKSGHRAIYLTPLRALAEELHPAWEKEFSPDPVGLFTGDYGTSGKEYPVPFAKARVMIMTPERLDACTRGWRSHWQWIPEVDLVVVDEFHLLGDRHRGARLEGAISRLRRLNPFCRFLCLSATLGNREELADWLEAVEYSSEWRPVPLSWRVSRYRKADEKPSLLTEEVSRSKAAGGRSLVFVQSRRRAETLAAHLRAQGLRAAFHHAGLTHKARHKAEHSLKSAELDALVATGTLEMGLNLPVRQVILYDTQAFDGARFSPLEVNTVWQRAGRAGRPGLDETGEAVLFTAAWERGGDSYPLGKFERIESRISSPAALAEQILAEVASGLCRSEIQLRRAFGKSLAAFQGKSLAIEKTVTEMTDSGMIKYVETGEGDNKKLRLVPTALGRIATRQLLQPATVLMMRRILQTFPKLPFFDMLAALALVADCEPVIPADYEELSNLSNLLEQFRGILPVKVADFREVCGAPSGKRFLSAIKTAAILMSWTNLGGEAEVAEEYGVYQFEVRRLCECFDRLLIAFAAVSHSESHANSEESEKKEKSPTTKRIDLLRHMIAAGLPQRSASLTFVPGIGGKWARKLSDNGIRDLRALAGSLPQHICGIRGLSVKRAGEWIAEAKKLSGEQLPCDIDAPRIQAIAESVTVDKNVDVYRMRRAKELKVEDLGGGEYIVSGGLEPHRVKISGEEWACDCADFAKGNVCKHILAAKSRMQMSAHTVKASDSESTEGDSLNLSALWSEP